MKLQILKYGLPVALVLVFAQAAQAQQFTKIVREDGLPLKQADNRYRDTLKEGETRTIQLFAESAGTAAPLLVARNLQSGWMYFAAPKAGGAATLRLLPVDDGAGDYTLYFEAYDRNDTDLQHIAKDSLLLHIIDRNRLADDENELKVAVYPNPVSSKTTFEVVIPRAGAASLKIYTLDGREVMTVFDAGAIRYRYFNTVNLSSLPSGTYVYRLKVDGVGNRSGQLVKL